MKASMGPERKAPENVRTMNDSGTFFAASMGPERKAPENTKSFITGKFSEIRFNGAGAKGSGKLGCRDLRNEAYRHASMGPEAGAKGSGKLRRQSGYPDVSICFNGAGAKGSGKH